MPKRKAEFQVGDRIRVSQKCMDFFPGTVQPGCTGEIFELRSPSTCLLLLDGPTEFITYFYECQLSDIVAIEPYGTKEKETT